MNRWRRVVDRAIGLTFGVGVMVGFAAFLAALLHARHYVLAALVFFLGVFGLALSVAWHEVRREEEDREEGR